MAVTEVDIQPLFATPYMRADVRHAISEKQVKYIKDLKMIQNRTNFITEDLYIFQHEALKSVAEAIQESLDIYAQKVMGITQKIEVTQSWGLMNPPGVGMHAHSHSNSIVSGSLYYDELPEPPSRLFFDRYTAYRRIELNPESDRHNLYNTPTNIVTPKTGEVLLFPSDINHMVESNGSSKPRHVIAFNAFVKGKIGHYRDVSELTFA